MSEGILQVRGEHFRSALPRLSVLSLESDMAIALVPKPREGTLYTGESGKGPDENGIYEKKTKKQSCGNRTSVEVDRISS